MKHLNNGDCPKCNEIIYKYPNPYEPLVQWFKASQKLHPEMHCSCLGRGEAEQEQAFKDKKSNAHFGESSHNYNAGLDVFVIQKGLYIYDEKWFFQVFKNLVPVGIKWLGEHPIMIQGKPASDFPHCQPLYWKKLVTDGIITLIK